MSRNMEQLLYEKRLNRLRLFSLKKQMAEEEYDKGLWNCDSTKKADKKLLCLSFHNPRMTGKHMKLQSRKLQTTKKDLLFFPPDDS